MADYTPNSNWLDPTSLPGFQDPATYNEMYQASDAGFNSVADWNNAGAPAGLPVQNVQPATGGGISYSSTAPMSNYGGAGLSYPTDQSYYNQPATNAAEGADYNSAYGNYGQYSLQDQLAMGATSYGGGPLMGINDPNSAQIGYGFGGYTGPSGYIPPDNAVSGPSGYGLLGAPSMNQMMSSDQYLQDLFGSAFQPFVGGGGTSFTDTGETGGLVNPLDFSDATSYAQIPSFDNFSGGSMSTSGGDSGGGDSGGGGGGGGGD